MKYGLIKSRMLRSFNMPTDADFASLIESQMEQRGILGLNLLVCQHGQVLEQRSYGVANLEHNVPVTFETVFQIGSIGKQFAATAIMLLVAQGKIDLEAGLAAYLEAVPESWSAVRIRHLLSHTAGVPSEADGLDLRLDFTEDQLLEKIFAGDLEFAPGEQFSYSNDGYKLIGILISKVTGMFYGDYLHQEIFLPSGMKNARIINDTAIVLNRAAGYVSEGLAWRNQDWVSPTFNSTADGALYMTLDDLARWENAFHNGTILSHAVLEEMYTPCLLNDGSSAPYGFGWSLNEKAGLRIAEHGGNWQGFTAYYLRVLGNGLSVVVLTNQASVGLERLVYGIAGLFTPELTPPPEQEPIDDLEKDTTAIDHSFLLRWAAGELEASEFTAELWDPAFIADVGEHLAQQACEPKLELLERMERDDMQISRYRVTFYKERLRFSIARNTEGKVALLMIRPS